MATVARRCEGVGAGARRSQVKHDGKALLVLFDFSDTPYSEEQIESFRNWPSLGRGNHRKSAFNVVYFFVEKRRPLALGKITKNIRIT